MTKHHEIYLSLYDQISSGKLRSGERLPSEPELARQLGVNRKTLRNALERLELEGLLFRHVRKGTFVRKIQSSAKPQILIVCEDSTELPAYSNIPDSLAGVLMRSKELGIECIRISPCTPLEILPLEGNIMGIIIVGVSTSEDEIVKVCRSSGFPIVNLAGFEESVRDIGGAGVLPDRHAAWFAGLDHLLQRGHRRIGFPMYNDWKSCNQRMGISRQEVEKYLIMGVST